MPVARPPRSRSLPPEPETVGVVIAVAVLTALLFQLDGGWAVACAALDGWMLRMLYERRP